MDSNTKYSLLLKEYIKLYMEEIEEEDNQHGEDHNDDYFFPTKTFSELIHSESIFPLLTHINPIDQIMNVNSIERLNDIYEYYYTDISTLYQVFYRQLIFACGPDELSCIKEKPQGLFAQFMCQQCLIFSYCGIIINKEIFIDQYLEPFINDELNIFIKDHPNYGKIKAEWIKRTLENIIVETFTSLEELLVKIITIPHLQTLYPNICLIVIDGMNRLTKQKLEINYDKETNSKRRITFQFKKKRKKANAKDKSIVLPQEELENLVLSGQESEKKIVETINYVLNEIQIKGNINLIHTFFDYDNYYHRMNVRSMIKMNHFIDKKTHFRFPVHDENDDNDHEENEEDNENKQNNNSLIEFIFKLIPIKDMHKIFFIEPTGHVYNSNRVYFGILSLCRENTYSFKAFYREKGHSEVRTIITKEIKKTEGYEDSSSVAA